MTEAAAPPEQLRAALRDISRWATKQDPRDVEALAATLRAKADALEWQTGREPVAASRDRAGVAVGHADKLPASAEPRKPHRTRQRPRNLHHEPQIVAWVMGSPEMVAAIRTAKQFLTYVASGPFQYAVVEALALPATDYTDLRTDLRAKRDIPANGLKDAGFDVYRPQGTYFVTTGIAALTDQDAVTFCRALPEAFNG